MPNFPWKMKIKKHFYMKNLVRFVCSVQIWMRYKMVERTYKSCTKHLFNFRKTEKETSKILINSSFALLLTHASYQIYTFLEEYCTCLIINFITHYFVLAFLLWTAADGINMWRMLFTNVFNTNGYVFYRWYKIICWGKFTLYWVKL